MTSLTLLESLQSLLQESRYTTTYKFALLHALCDLSLELPAKETRLPLNHSAERVIELYWQEVVPFAPFNTRSTLSLPCTNSHMGWTNESDPVTAFDRKLPPPCT